MNAKRVRWLKPGVMNPGPVVYWMSRDQRCQDNWALLYAQKLARESHQPLICVFCLVPRFLGANIRHYGFMLKGLREVESSLEKKNIPFVLLFGNPREEIPQFLKKQKAGILVTDFDPLRVKRRWKDTLAKKVFVPFCEVDSHNIVPCWIASPKLEYGAYTLRPKLHRLLPEFLEEFPELEKQKGIPPLGKGAGRGEKGGLRKTLDQMKIDRTVLEVDWIAPGEDAAQKALKDFVRNRLAGYAERRNDPNLNGQSGLSPYLHFGQLSSQRAALVVARASVPEPDKNAFLEELIVRRELADNFCFYQPDYDNWNCLTAWAKKTLGEHRGDKREYVYSFKQFEAGQTHDELWNAAQTQMVKTGKMHGFMRMYWAKKILEWTASPQDAFKVATGLNDKYELDGRDPNGYAGIAWSLGGVHDRAWGERPVFGKIRYMSYNGCKGKFDIKKYIETHRNGSKPARVKCAGAKPKSGGDAVT